MAAWAWRHVTLGTWLAPPRRGLSMRWVFRGRPGEFSSGPVLAHCL